MTKSNSDKNQLKHELKRINKKVDQLSTTVDHLKSCHAVYVIKSEVRTPDAIKTVEVHRTNKQKALEAMSEMYREVTGQELKQPKDFVRYEDKTNEVWATFEIYKPRMA
jgi:phage shock protein A